MYDGGEVYVSKDPLIEEGLERLWYTWATRYKDGSVDAGPGSIIAVSPPDSISIAAIDCGLPVQFRSMVVRVFISAVVYQLSYTQRRPQIILYKQGFPCRIQWA